jgi:hypothetical protein
MAEVAIGLLVGVLTAAICLLASRRQAAPRIEARDLELARVEAAKRRAMRSMTAQRLLAEEQMLRLLRRP